MLTHSCLIQRTKCSAVVEGVLQTYQYIATLSYLQQLLKALTFEGSHLFSVKAHLKAVTFLCPIRLGAYSLEPYSLGTYSLGACSPGANSLQLPISGQGIHSPAGGLQSGGQQSGGQQSPTTDFGPGDLLTRSKEKM